MQSRSQICTLLCNWFCDNRTFHFTCIVYYDPPCYLQNWEHTIFSLVWLSLSNYHCWIYLLFELWLVFLHCGHCHVTHTSSGKSIQSSLDPLHRDDVQIFSSCVVSTIDHSSYQKTQRSLEFHTRGATTSLLWHLEHWEGTEAWAFYFYNLLIL